jgi:hypothetical protein
MTIDDHRGRTRTGDYSTSVEGAASVAYRAGSQKDRLLKVYAAHPGGLTDEEAAYICGLLDSCYWKRCNELRQDGKIVVTERTRKGRAGVSRVICTPAP